MTVLRFWKPYQVLTKFTDAEGRATLADYISQEGVYAAGRLDYDSEGLLILTDDGTLNARLTQPRYEHPRTYWAQVERVPDESALAQLRQGVEIKGGLTRPAQVRLIAEPDLPPRPVPIRYRKNVPTAWIELTLTEGRNRQVRRMTAAVGHPTLRLVRWAVGDMTLVGLEPGQWQPLSTTEVDALQRSIRKLKR
ncbi:pseudouridine synthase [Phototrophicus methaneseepsis]|uniref:Pseudouridine synthase n=1 Tax=Phototrophicus methaneseepsis TaxID=2710758 RepID=A0A7S8IGW0_9CHLR|nr:pseudouridine synthase [Phototrophicus methaneseepsis]QPC85246.1 pseudouridine synthase [Phototrophicus methaneseepsis]